MKVRLPGLDSNMAMNLPFIVTGLVQLSLANALCVGMVSTFVQCLPGNGRKNGSDSSDIQRLHCGERDWPLLFGSYVAKADLMPQKPALIVLGTLVFFPADSIPVAAIISAVTLPASLGRWHYR